jgi:hypothetical protein
MELLRVVGGCSIDGCGLSIGRGTTIQTRVVALVSPGAAASFFHPLSIHQTFCWIQCPYSEHESSIMITSTITSTS